jgi:dTDP-4-dehydrorhamnose reductase
VPEASISKYELLCLFNTYLRRNKIRVTPVEGVRADKSLKRTNFTFNYIIPDYERMVADLAEWMLQHKHMYPHYEL